MKYKNTIYILLILFVSLIGMWGIPSLVKIAVYGQDRYPFVYYSSLLKEFCFTEFDGRKNALHDVSGRVYTREQFDSVMPLLNFRQLHSNGTMPDSVEGIALDPRILRTKQVVFRYSPKDIHTPDRGLYIMYESLSGRVNLESPGDVFRLKDKIEFIDIKSNAVNEKKSALFQAALEKEGYAFPAQWTSGNLNIRKPYDEGYFSLDMNGNLFHIKMVNSRPYVRDTKIGKQMKIVWFSLLEVADKRFYGFLFDKEGKVYIVEEGGGKYSPLKLSIDPLDLDKDNLSIMGNLLYWTVSIENTLGKRIYALKTNDLTRVDSYFVPAPDNKWNAYSKLLFPVYLTFKSPDSDYIAPYIHITGFYGFVFNVICSVAAVLLGNSVKRRMFNFIYVLFTGIAGVIALLLIPAFKEQK